MSVVPRKLPPDPLPARPKDPKTSGGLPALSNPSGSPPALSKTSGSPPALSEPPKSFEVIEKHLAPGNFKGKATTLWRDSCGTLAGLLRDSCGTLGPPAGLLRDSCGTLAGLFGLGGPPAGLLPWRSVEMVEISANQLAAVENS